MKNVPNYLLLFLFIFLLNPLAIFAQKELLEYLKEFSPDGYYIITEYERLTNDPGYHKQFVDTKDQRLCIVAVHEVNHMLNWKAAQNVNSKFGFYMGNKEVAMVKNPITYFNSEEIAKTIPTEFHTFTFEIYIKEGGNTGSRVYGIYGIMDEYDAYIDGFGAAIDLYPCYKEENKKSSWQKYFTDASSSFYNCVQFRYYIFKYIMYAQTNHPEVYENIIKDELIKDIYTRLTIKANEFLTIHQNHFNEINKELEQNGEGKMDDIFLGLKEHTQFKTEIAKKEYTDVEKLITNQTFIAFDPIKAPAIPQFSIFNNSIARVTLFSLKGKEIYTSNVLFSHYDLHEVMEIALPKTIGSGYYVMELSNKKTSVFNKIHIVEK